MKNTIHTTAIGLVSNILVIIGIGSILIANAQFDELYNLSPPGLIMTGNDRFIVVDYQNHSAGRNRKSPNDPFISIGQRESKTSYKKTVVEEIVGNTKIVFPEHGINDTYVKLEKLPRASKAEQLKIVQQDYDNYNKLDAQLMQAGVKETDISRAGIATILDHLKALIKSIDFKNK